MSAQHVLAWASGHVQQLRNEIERFETDNKRPLLAEPNGVSGEYLMKHPSAMPTLNPDWVFRIGDAMHGFRVALDYLAFGIIKPTTEKHIKDTAFPILRRNGNWGSLHTMRLPGAPPDVIKIFHQLQPDFGNNWNGIHQLTLLDDLENVHKHRHPIGVSFNTPIRGFSGWGEPNFDILDKYPFSSDAGAPVYRILLRNPGDAGPYADFEAPIRVSFDKSGPALGLPVLEVLERIEQFIGRDVFRALGAKV